MKPATFPSPRGLIQNSPVQNAVYLLISMCLMFSWPVQAQQSHRHDAVPDMDETGRRLDSYEVRHDLGEQTLAALRSKLALYRGMTDREIGMNMAGMGPNYEWYVSDPGLSGKTGVLVLTHGVGENSDGRLRKAMMPLAARWPTAIGFGMAMMSSAHLQSAVDDLVAHGAEQIILVQTTGFTPYNSLSRQWAYIFGMQAESAYLDVDRVSTGARLLMAEQLGGHPLATGILYDHAKEVSTHPANEVLILVGHGPEDVEDNKANLEIMRVHADRIRDKREFHDVRIVNLQDDALPPVRQSNVRKLRRWVQAAGRKDQQVIIVAIAVASHGLQAHIRQDLRGLNYIFADKGMSEHPDYVRWVETTIDEKLKSL